MTLFQIKKKTFVFISVLKGENPVWKSQVGQEDWQFSRCSAWLRLQLTLLQSQVPVGEGEVKTARWLACHHIFPLTFFFPHQFSEASLQYSERKHIKDSWSCRELGFQKRTAKGYLHTRCKAFFTLHTSLLATRYEQRGRKMPICLCDIQLLLLLTFRLDNKDVIFKTYICNYSKYQCHQAKIWSLCRL